MYPEEVTLYEKFTEWDCYLKGSTTPKRFKTKPTIVKKAMSVIAEQEGIKKSEIIAVQGILNNETK